MSTGHRFPGVRHIGLFRGLAIGYGRVNRAGARSRTPAPLVGVTNASVAKFADREEQATHLEGGALVFGEILPGEADQECDEVDEECDEAARHQVDARCTKL